MFFILKLLQLALVFTNGSTPDSIQTNFFHIYRNIAFEYRARQNKTVTEENITYYLYTNDNPQHYIQLSPKNMKILQNRNEKLVFFIHGWSNGREVRWYEDLKNAFLRTYKGSYSIIQMDWKEAANQFYYVSFFNTFDAAVILAQQIINLNKDYNVHFDNITLIGHSLGAQMSGLVGKHIFNKTLKKIARIIALDPAGPIFNMVSDEERLNKKDAEVVEVVHSNGGTFGFKDSCGTIDFFPNGGLFQPGCRKIDVSEVLDIDKVGDMIACDHQRAYDYFIEAVLNPREFLAKKCESWDLFAENKCENVQVALGNLTTDLEGTFYFETNSEKPFSNSRVLDIFGNNSKILFG